MSRRIGLSQKWKLLQEQMFSATDTAFRLDRSTTPVRLKPIALRRQVRRFKFMRLPVDGGLKIVEGGFMIYVNCDEAETEHWDRLMEIDGGATLPARLRFTIAHEIAHTFFYDLSKAKPVPLVDCTNRRSLDSLERTCNRGAAQILIPEMALEKKLVTAEFDPGNPSAIVGLAGEFGVSLETLILRLTFSPSWSTLRTSLLLLESDAAGLPCTRSSVLEPALMLALKARYQGDPLVYAASVDRECNGTLLRGSIDPVVDRITCGSTRQPCQLRCSHYHSDRFLLSIRRHKPVERIPAATLAGGQVCQGKNLVA